MFELITPYELQILQWIQENMQSPFLNPVMVFFTNIGYGGAIWLVIGLAMVALKKYRRNGFYMLLALLTVTILGELGLKHIITRARPCQAYPIENLLVKMPITYSFPSGHTGSSFTCSIFLGLQYKKAKLPLLVLASVIAFSRLYLYLHYPSDILGGILLGGFTAYYWHRKLQDRAAAS